VAYFFELPKIDDLTEDQQMALDEVRPIRISGGAGTGKTVVSLWRHIQNIDDFNKSSMLTTYTKTLNSYLFNSALKESREAQKYIWTSFVIYTHAGQWKVDEIIIDEAQDLTFQHLQDMKKYANHISYGADFNQKLYLGTVTEDEIKRLFPDNVEYNLQQNFRNSYHILNFTKSVLVNFLIPQNTIDELEYENIGIKPIMCIVDNFEKEIEKIIEIINEFRTEKHTIAILLPFQDGRNSNGEIWNFAYAQCVDKYHKELINRGIFCSAYYNKMNIDFVEIDNVHITTFKSVKGLEFNTVIIPNFNNMNENIKDIRIINEEDYYVAFTRARKNLYLFSSSQLNFVNNSICEIEHLNNSHYNKLYISQIETDENKIPF
jgi:DNA helicase IV